MNQISAPQSLRILLAWPDVPARTLRRALRDAALPLEIDAISASSVSQYLTTSGFYHLLYLSPEDWRKSSVVTRQRLAARVSLIILGPAPAGEADLAELQTGLYILNERGLEEVVSRVVDLHRGLTHGLTLQECVEQSAGAFTLIGHEACWPEIKPPKIVNETSSAATSQSGGVNMREIGAVHVGGDVVGRDKIVSETHIGQVVHEHISGPKIVQQAGGDQINLNRVTDAAPEITQTAEGDQVNRNTVSGTLAA